MGNVQTYSKEETDIRLAKLYSANESDFKKYNLRVDYSTFKQLGADFFNKHPELAQYKPAHKMNEEVTKYLPYAVGGAVVLFMISR